MYFIVTFVLDNQLMEVSEEAFLSNLDNIKQMIHNGGSFEGAIVMEFDDGNSIRIDDELPALTRNFCFNSLVKLIEEKNASHIYYYMTSTLHVIMIPMANVIRVLGEDITPFTIEKDIFFRNLLECGLRFLKMLSLFEDQTKNLVNALTPFALQAENAFNQQKHD